MDRESVVKANFEKWSEGRTSLLLTSTDQFRFNSKSIRLNIFTAPILFFSPTVYLRKLWLMFPAIHNMHTYELMANAMTLSSIGKGIISIDEMPKVDLSQYISGIILSENTIFEKKPDLLYGKKVDISQDLST